MFLNLHVLQPPDFADHNFGELGYINRETSMYVRSQLQRGYSPNGEWMEPYFFGMVRLTLSAGAAAAYIRTHPDLPLTERDCSLSKVFQLIYVALEIRFSLPDSPPPDIQLDLEDLLDQLPDSVLPKLPEFDWEGFYFDVLHYDLETVLTRLHERFRMALSAWGGPGGRAGGKRGPKADSVRHSRIADIVRRTGTDWRTDGNLWNICASLDKAGIKVSTSWHSWRPPALSFRKAVKQRKHDVIKALQYSLNHAPRR